MGGQKGRGSAAQSSPARNAGLYSHRYEYGGAARSG